MGASLDFYRALGLDIPDGVESEPHVDAVLPSGVTLAWDTIDLVKSFDTDWVAPSGSQRIALAFAFDSPAEVDATVLRMGELGYRIHLEPWDAFWGQRYATLIDPDGNSIDLFAALEG